METELERLRNENATLKAKLKKKKGDKVQQVERWREKNKEKYIVEKKRELEKRKERRRQLKKDQDKKEEMRDLFIAFCEETI